MVMVIIGELGQWLAVLSSAGGIIIEIIYKADIGFIAITGGSVMFALSMKIKSWGLERERIRRESVRSKLYRGRKS